MLGRAVAIGRFLAVALAMPVLLVLAASAARPTLAGVAADPVAPSLYVDDGPFTRNTVVRLSITADGLYASPAVEWWAANDPATANGRLVNAASVPTGVGNWALAAGPDGPRTIYAQSKHANGAWSAVGSLTLTLATDPGSRLLMDVEPNGRFDDLSADPVVDWHTIWATPADAISGHATTFAGQSVNVNAGGWGVTLATTSGLIAPGTYELPTPPSDGSCGTVCAGVSRAFHGSCLGGGTFAVNAIEISPDDDLEVLDADFRLSCGTTVMAGSIRYGSGAEIGALDQSVESLAFGDVDIGSTSGAQSVTVTNIGNVPNTLGAASITGGAAGDFAIVTDGCAGVTLAVGESCSVSAEFSPTDRAHRFTSLVIPETTAKQRRHVQLGGRGWQPVTLAVDVVTLPDYGPADATITVTAFDVGVDVTGPWLVFDDGSVVQSITSAVLSDPLRSVTTYVVELGPGSHHVEGRFAGRQHAFYRDADPVSTDVDVGTEAWLDLTTTTDDGVMLGESVDLIARLITGGPVTGTLQIREGTDGPIVASEAVTGTTDVSATVTLGVGSHDYTAAFVPTSPETQAVDDAHTVEVVDGPRPETTMDSTPLATWGQAQTSFSSPTPGVTFECQSRLSDDESPFVNFYPCTSPSWFLTNTKGWNEIFVRARLANGLADRTPASRLWYYDWDLTGTTSIDGGAPFSADTAVTVATVKPAGSPSVTHVGLSNDGVNFTSFAYAASKPWTLPAGNGPRTVYARWRDGNGAWSAPAADTIVLDTKAPTATAPVAGFVTGSTLAGGPIPVRLTWTGSDNQAGVGSYHVSRSIDGGAWSAATTVTAPTATLTQSLGFGHTYRFRVRPIDKAGNAGAWAYAATFTLSAAQQTTSAAVYSGAWTTVSGSTYWGSSARASSSAGSRVRFTFTGKAFGWVTSMSSARGRAAIYVNGTYQGTVDLYSATAKAKVLGWTKRWSTSATRTVEIRVLGTAGRPRVDVDGFWWLR